MFLTLKNVINLSIWCLKYMRQNINYIDGKILNGCKKNYILQVKLPF